MRLFLTINLLTLLLLLNSCVNNCEVTCPSKCIPIDFVLTQDSFNIQSLQTPPYTIEEIQMETLSENTVSPNLFEIQAEKFTFVGCDGAIYQLVLDQDFKIEIVVELQTISEDDCCSFFSASSITFNETELCSTSSSQCSGGSYEL